MKGPNSFYASATVIIIFSTILGIFPMYAIKQKEKLQFKTSRALHLITVAFMVLYTLVILYSMKERRGSSEVVSGKYYQSSKVSSIGLTFEFLGGILILYTIYACSLFKINDVHKTLQNLDKIDTQLQGLGQKFQYKRDLFYQILILSTGLLLILVISSLQRHNIYREHLVPLSPIIWTVLIFPLVVLNVMDCQFSFTVLAINDRFKKINDQFTDLTTLYGTPKPNKSCKYAFSNIYFSLEYFGMF